MHIRGQTADGIARALSANGLLVEVVYPFDQSLFGSFGLGDEPGFIGVQGIRRGHVSLVSLDDEKANPTRGKRFHSHDLILIFFVGFGEIVYP